VLAGVFFATLPKQATDFETRPTIWMKSSWSRLRGRGDRGRRQPSRMRTRRGRHDRLLTDGPSNSGTGGTSFATACAARNKLYDGDDYIVSSSHLTRRR